MRITLKLYSFLGPYLPPGAVRNVVETTVPEGATPWAVLDSLNVPREHCHLVLVNGVYLDPEERGERVLEERDVLAVWPAVAGG